MTFSRRSSKILTYKHKLPNYILREVNVLQKLCQEAKSQLSIKEDVLNNDDKIVNITQGYHLMPC